MTYNQKGWTSVWSAPNCLSAALQSPPHSNAELWYQTCQAGTDGAIHDTEQVFSTLCLLWTEINMKPQAWSSSTKLINTYFRMQNSIEEQTL